MHIKPFLHSDSETFTYVLADNTAKICAIIDPCMDFNTKSAHITYESTDKVIEYIQSQGYKISHILETHAHADHLSSAKYIQQQLGGQIVIGSKITDVQRIFKTVYNLDLGFKTDASQFDMLVEDGDTFKIGHLKVTAKLVAGHTPADIAYVVESEQSTDLATQKAIFIGDTLFAPDVGTARCDFPGGDASTLYESIQTLFSYPDDTLLYLCHDYPPKNTDGKRRDYEYVHTVAEQKKNNIHIKNNTTKEEFVTMRNNRDATLDVPRLIIPSIQVNITAGELPKAENNGVQYLKIPINVIGK